MSAHSVTRFAQVTLGKQLYHVTYEIHGECRQESYVKETRIVSVYSDDERAPLKDAALFAALITQLETLPLNDYLYESWSNEHDGD